MIVPSMTLEEIRKEINKDFPILYRKMGYVAAQLQKELGKTIKEKEFVQFYEYRSKYNNRWLYRMLVTKKKSSYFAYLIYHNGRGHAAVAVTHDLNIIYYTGHFFERYNERCKLGLKTLDEIIRSYMNESNVYRFQEVEEVAPGVFKIFCIISTGILLGIYNKPLELVKANTFVTNEMLGKDQVELKTYINDKLDKYKHHSGSIRDV